MRENERAILDFHSKIEVGDIVKIHWNYDYNKDMPWVKPDIRRVEILDKKYKSDPTEVVLHGVDKHGRILLIPIPAALIAILDITKAK